MLSYLFKRILFTIPTLVGVTLLIFFLQELVPNDPVAVAAQNSLASGNQTQNADFQLIEKKYHAAAKRFSLDKPAFYCAIQPAAYPDTLYKIPRRDVRDALTLLTSKYGNWAQTQVYYQTLIKFQQTFRQIPDSIDITALRSETAQLLITGDAMRIKNTLSELNNLPNIALFQAEKKTLDAAFEALETQEKTYLMYVPKFVWHGLDNRYHLQIRNFFSGKFGISYIDGQPVAQKIGEGIGHTLLISIFSLLLSFFLSIIIGIKTAKKPNSTFDKATRFLSLSLYALPSFWLATLVLVFFTTPEYGMNWFAGIGIGDLPKDAPFFERWWEAAPHFVLPIFCNVLLDIAVLSRQARGSMLDILSQPFIQTAYAKGLNEQTVVLRHALRNALFPMIGFLAAAFSTALAATLVVEVVFNIPGIGKMTTEAILSRDYPLLFSLLMLTALLTIIGNLLADVLYRWADPRVE
jgi:peptide/nickel transport system permease protein